MRNRMRNRKRNRKRNRRRNRKRNRKRRCCSVRSHRILYPAQVYSPYLIPSKTKTASYWYSNYTAPICKLTQRECYTTLERRKGKGIEREWRVLVQ
jgi:hypothetical protein